MEPKPITNVTNDQAQDMQFADHLTNKGIPVPRDLHSQTGFDPAILPPATRPLGGDKKIEDTKKQVLQKLMSNLLDKPGRSMHEIINGIKAAIGAYKNYSKEVDSLNGGGTTTPMQDSGSTPAMPTPPMQDGAGGPGNSQGIQQILNGIRQKKATQPQTQNQAPQPVAQQAPVPQSAPVAPPSIAGQQQESTFNRPAPVSHLGMWGF